MTRHVAIIGIDGSGKSTLARTLPSLVAARFGVRAACAGASFEVAGPEGDLASGGFAARGLPMAARLAPALRRLARRCAHLIWLYPTVKLLSMLVQDLAARRLGTRYRADVVFSDGQALLCAAGRLANYAEGAAGSRLIELLRFLRGGPLPSGMGLFGRVRLRAARAGCRVARALGLDLAWLPDVAVFLDVSPAAALGRIAARGTPTDRHENLADMSEARDCYIVALGALESEGAMKVRVIATESASVAETCQRTLEALAPELERASAALPAAADVLGTSAATRRQAWKNVLRPDYFAYLVSDARRGAWREPFFFASRMGRALLREGYSAAVMGHIYSQDASRAGRLDRVFLGYPLHRAVHERLHLLVDRLAREIAGRLSDGGHVRIFTAPCGTAEDVFRALERVARLCPGAMKRVQVVAADLDPQCALSGSLRDRAAGLGVELDFVRCDLTDPASRQRFGTARFDVALFVGLSSWIDKPALVRHLSWLKSALKVDGTLVTDCFSAASYARSGWIAGYRASYFAPPVFAALLETCGFDGRSVRIASGSDGINHVVVARPRAPGPRRRDQESMTGAAPAMRRPRPSTLVRGSSRSRADQPGRARPAR